MRGIRRVTNTVRAAWIWTAALAVVAMASGCSSSGPGVLLTTPDALPGMPPDAMPATPDAMPGMRDAGPATPDGATPDGATPDGGVEVDLTTEVTGVPVRGSLSRMTEVTLLFSTDDRIATFECQIDGNDFTRCESPLVLHDIIDGAHLILVRARLGDRRGPPAAWPWTVDTIAPISGIAAPVTSADHPGRERRPTFTGTSEPGATVTLYHTIDCAGPPAGPTTTAAADRSFSVTIDEAAQAPADGRTEYSVRGVDAAGNLGACSFAFSYFTDNTSPAVEVTGPATDPARPQRERRPRLTGSAELGVSVRVFRSGDCTGPATAPTVAASASWAIDLDAATEAAADGATIYTAQATDAAGNVRCSAPLTYFTDNTAPDTQITSQFASATNNPEHTFAFTSSDPDSRFECDDGDGRFHACTTAGTERIVTSQPGTVTFRVRAIDPVGNADPTPATFRWTYTNGPLVQYAMEGDAAETGALGAQLTGDVSGATLVPGRLGGALSFPGTPSSRFVAPVGSVLRTFPRLTVQFWFKDRINRAATGGAATFFDNGILKIRRKATSATAAPFSSLEFCVDGVCTEVVFVSIGQWHSLGLSFSASSLAVVIDGAGVASRISLAVNPFDSDAPIVLGQNAAVMVDDLRIYDFDYPSASVPNGERCRLLGSYDRRGSCLVTVPAQAGFALEQDGKNEDNANGEAMTISQAFAPGHDGSYGLQFVGDASVATLPASALVGIGRRTLSYWMREDARRDGSYFATDPGSQAARGFVHRAIGGSQVVDVADGRGGTLRSDVTVPVGPWHHYVFAYDGPANGTGDLQIFVDGRLATDVGTVPDPFTTPGPGIFGQGVTAYVDTVRVHKAPPLDSQTVCQLEAGGDWIDALGACRFYDVPAGACVDQALGSDSGDGSCSHPYATIARALSSAVPGRIIQVRPGTYRTTSGEVFPLVVPERVALVGDERLRGATLPGPTRVDGCGVGAAGSLATIVLGGREASVSGLQVTCAGSPLASAVVIGAPGTVVRSNRLENVGNGVLNGLNDETLIAGNEIFGNTTGVAVDAGTPRFDNDVIRNNRVGIRQRDAASSLDLNGGMTGSAGGNELACSAVSAIISVNERVFADAVRWQHSPVRVQHVVRLDDCETASGQDVCLATTSNPHVGQPAAASPICP